MPTEKLKITEIITKTRKRDNPVLLRFQNGGIKPGKLDVSYFKAKDTRLGDQKLAVVATKTNVYRGPINDNLSSNLINKYLAIKNKHTGKVRLIEIDEASLLNDLYYKNEAKIANQFTGDSARNLAIKNFGGRIANRFLDRTERMKVNVDVVKNQLEKTLESSTVADDEAPISGLDQIRPPFNPHAKKLEDVFKLNEIIPQELFDRMDKEAVAVLTTSTKDLPIASEYLLGKINEIQNSQTPDSTINLTTLKVFIYMDALQNLIKNPEKNLAKVQLSEITEKVERDIRGRFGDPNLIKLTKTRHTKDKAICYFLALALLTSKNYEISLNTLTQDLTITRVTLIKYAQLVHAKPIIKSDMLSLRLPGSVRIAPAYKAKRHNK